jgi:hypothetical protein
MVRFDKAIFRRNSIEYVVGAGMMIFFGWLALMGDEPLKHSVSIVCVGFVLLYLWWKHRHIRPLDPAADGRSYQAAMLERIDCQMQLLRTVRYWYLLPLYIPGLWTVANTWRRSPVAAILGWILITGVFAFIGWLNERAGVAFLRAERAKIEALYREES